MLHECEVSFAAPLFTATHEPLKGKEYFILGIKLFLSGSGLYLFGVYIIPASWQRLCVVTGKVNNTSNIPNNQKNFQTYQSDISIGKPSSPKYLTDFINCNALLIFSFFMFLLILLLLIVDVRLKQFINRCFQKVR